MSDAITPRWWAHWWAHFEFTRINIELTILYKKIEDVREVGRDIANASALIASSTPTAFTS